MNFSLVWLFDVLKDAGLKVAPDTGWEIRGNKGLDVGPIKGVICHHTGTNANGNMPTHKTLIQGRSDLSGPLSQLGLGRDGTFYLIAAGRCNHAGKGEWQGINTGNTNFIGIEAENRGTATDPWPEVQMEAYRHGVAAILKHLGLPAIMCCGHKEYAKPTGRKDDPFFDMVIFRKAVDDILKGVTPKLALIPAQEVTVAAGKVARPTLRRLTTGAVEWVKMLQEELGIGVDGQFGSKTEAALREFQRSQGLVDDGIAGPNTWYALDNPVKPIQLAGTHSISTADTGQETVQPIDPDVWLGQLSAKYETGNRGPGTVSSGVGDPGGVSYGSYQMTSKPDGGTVKQFIEKEGKTWEGKFNGLTPGKSAFTIAWKEIASTQEKAFQTAQHDFIKRIYFDPLVSHIKETTSLDLTTRSHALQNAVWSTAVQHGPNNKIISNALDNLKVKGQDVSSEDKFDEHLIEAIYAERGRRQADDRLVYFHSSSLDVQKGIANRLVAELADALKMLKDET